MNGSMREEPLPKHLDAKSPNVPIDRDDHKLFDVRLRGEHAVERIQMFSRNKSRMDRMGCRDRDAEKSCDATMSSNVAGQVGDLLPLTEPVLVGDFEGRDGAYDDLVCGVGNRPLCGA
ncbi:MAG: hypothetical protein ACTHJ3_01695 [Pararhizobium sp.]